MSLGIPEQVARRRRRSGTAPMAARIRHLRPVPPAGPVVSRPLPKAGSSRLGRCVVTCGDLVLQFGCAGFALALAGRPVVAAAGPNSSLVLLSLVYAVLWGIAATVMKLYRDDLQRSVWRHWFERVKVSVAVFAVTGAAALIGIVDASFGPAATWALLLGAAAGGLLGACVVKLLTPSKWQRERALLVGTEESIARVAKRLDRHDCRVDVVGTFPLDVHSHPEGNELATGAGPELRIVEQVRALDASVVVLTTDAYVLGMHPMQVIWALESTGALLVMDTGMHTLPPWRIAFQRVGGLVTIQARPRSSHSLGSTLSGLAQWVVALVGLVVLAPVLLLVSAWIRLDSPGRAFFIQQRVGRNGVPFRMYKFRTMVQDAEHRVHELTVDPDAPDRGPLVKARFDHRITRAGKLLRASSLDELPQLLNVLRGEMRLVGPRPALQNEVDQYSGYQNRRLACKPGMTGLWQVSGRSDLDWARSVELDQTYVDGHSLGLDTYIVCRTPGAVFSSRGAY